MTDYIKREDAIKWLKNLFDDCGNYMPLWHYGEVLPKIIELLKVDVVRCKDCKWFNRFGCAVEIVDFTDRPTENDYCSFGERKDDE